MSEAASWGLFAAAIVAVLYVLLPLIGLGLLLWLGWRYFDKRYKSGPSVVQTNGLVRTTEIFIDPKDGNKYRVYYDPNTGERHYVPER